MAAAGQVQEKIEQALETVKNFNNREILFNLPYSEYQELSFLKEEFGPYKELWDLAWSFKQESQEWTNGSFVK
jgi:hypothetical protein